MMSGQWHKIAAIIMREVGLTQIQITPSMISDLHHSGQNIVADCRGGLTIRLLNDEQAREVMRGESQNN